MERPEHLPKELDKKTLTWLRSYGYCLNAEDERYKRIVRIREKGNYIVFFKKKFDIRLLKCYY